jgi:hypothetical protein
VMAGGSCHRFGTTTRCGGGWRRLLGVVPQNGATHRQKRALPTTTTRAGS